MKLQIQLVYKITIVLLFAVEKGLAQPVPFNQSVVDSITRQLPYAKADTNKVNNLILLAQMYIAKGDSARLMHYAQEANFLSQKIDFNIGRIRALSQMAFYHAITGNWPQSIMEIDEAIPLAQKEKTEWTISLYNLKFINYGLKDGVKQARIWALKALSDPIFPRLSDMSKWPTYMQLGLSYEAENRLDSAQMYASILKTYVKKYHHVDLEGNTYLLLGNIARRKKDYKEALYYYQLGDQNTLGIALVYNELNEADSAIHYAQKCLAIGQKGNNPLLIIESAQLLARLYVSTNPGLSNTYLQLYIDTKDALFNTDKLKQLEEISLNEQRNDYETQKKLTASQNRIILIALGVVLLFFLIFSIILWRNNRLKQAANRNLESTLSQLKTTQTQLIQKEKLASLGELTAGIAHEIQNPLNFVNNFSEVSTELVSELEEEQQKTTRDPELEADLLGDLKQNLQKITLHGSRASAIVRGMLEHSRTSTGQREPTDINALADEYLRLAYQAVRAKDKAFQCGLVTGFAPDLGKVNVVSQEIGRVLLNLYTNAFYAVQQKQKMASSAYQPTITVSTRLLPHDSPERATSSALPTGLGTRTGLGITEIRIADNGTGMSEAVKAKIFQPFFTTKPTGEGTGLGLSLSYDIITKGHGGTLEMASKEGEGTEFIITI